MSVKKCIIRKEDSCFTIIPNTILQQLPKIANYEALGLYTYMYSLPPGWEFYKEQLADNGNIGRDKINKLLAILEKHGLIEIAHIRDEKGRFAHFDIHVKSTDSFKINNLEKVCAPRTEKPLTDNQLLENSSYKENNKKQINNKINISCASDDGANSRFEEFWNAYPKKKDRRRTEEYWHKRNLDDKADMIIADVIARKENDVQWQHLQFIPYPSTYLHGDLWEDEIIPVQKKPLTQEKHIVQAPHAHVNVRPAINDPAHPNYNEYMRERERFKDQPMKSPSGPRKSTNSSSAKRATGFLNL